MSISQLEVLKSVFYIFSIVPVVVALYSFFKSYSAEKPVKYDILATVMAFFAFSAFFGAFLIELFDGGDDYMGDTVVSFIWLVYVAMSAVKLCTDASKS